MKCPFCHQSDSKVTDSRDAVEMNSIRRRRECLKCNNRFTTFETIDVTIQVKKRDGTYEDFQQEKLVKGLEAACRHSRISHDEVKALVAKITSELINKQTRVVDSRELGEIVIKYLQKLDTVAYIRFACVYKRFKDIEDLMGEIKSLVPMKGVLKKTQLTNKKGK